MPQGCSINLSFQPIHRRVPSRDFNFYSSQLQSLGYAFVYDRNMSSEAYNNDKEDYYLQRLEQSRYDATAERSSEIKALLEKFYTEGSESEDPLALL